MERSFLDFVTPFANFAQDTSYKAFSIADSTVSGRLLGKEVEVGGGRERKGLAALHCWPRHERNCGLAGKD